MPFDEGFLQELHARADIESVISPYVTLKRAGKLLKGLCPFHNEKTPSFTVYPETQSYYCFGCGSGGDAITFIKNIENLDYGEAVRFLADRVGLSVPQDNFSTELYDKRRKMYEANRAAARFFHKMLYAPEGEAGLRYFHDRGLTDQTIRKFGLGFAPSGWHALHQHLRKQGFSDRELYEANLLRMRQKDGHTYYYDAFSERVMFPIIDLRGNVLAFSGRALTSDNPRKYVNTGDTLIYKKGENLFALNLAKKSAASGMILCEGNMDVVTLHQAGFDNAVAGLGTALTEQQVALLSRYTGEVFLCYDADEAGRRAAEKAMRLFSKTTVRVKVIHMRGGKDPDEIIKTYGPERFRTLLGEAANNLEYHLLQAREKFDLTTSDGKTKYLSEACAVLADAKSAVEVDIYAGRLSEEFGVEKESIQKDVNRIRKQRVRQSEQNRLRDSRELEKNAEKTLNQVNPERARRLRAAKAEELLCASLMHNPEFFTQIKEEVSPDDFVTSFNRRVFAALCDRIAAHGGFTIATLTGDFTDAEIGVIAKIQTLIPQLANTLGECRDCIKVLHEEKNKRVGVRASDLSDADYLKLFQG